MISLDTLLQDARYAIRSLARSPAFTLTAALTLALGIGANTAVFSLVDAVVLRPLPYAHPERLFLLAEQRAQGERRLASYPTFEDYRAQSSAWRLGFALGQPTRLRAEAGTERRLVARVSRGYLDVLGVRPLLGRGFLPEEEQPGGARVVVLTHRLWRERFGGDPGVLGRTLRFGEGPATVVGVLPHGIGYPTWAELYAPLASAPLTPALERRDVHVDSRVVARLQAGTSLDRARAELQRIGGALAAEHPRENAGWAPVTIPLSDDVTGAARPQLLVLLGAVGLVLLIACVNVANLCLARATSRRRELAVRVALGAGRLRLARQLAAEAGAVALLGGILGLAAAAWGVDLLVRLGRGAELSAAAADLLPRLDEVAVNGRVLSFTAAVSLLTGLLAGVAPGLHAAAGAPAAALQEGARGGEGRRAGRVRATLVIAEVALAAALLVGAGLMIDSFRNLGRVDPGFRPEGLLAVRVLPPSPAFDDPASDVLSLYRELVDAVAPLPGVQAVALVNNLPMSGTSMFSPVEIEGRETPEPRESVGLRAVSEGYFETMGIPVLRGRSLRAADMSRSGVAAVVVSQALADRYWPDGEALGRRLTLFRASAGRSDFGEPVSGEVVGVAQNVQHLSLDQAPEPVAYLPYTMSPWATTYLVVRGDRPEALLSSVRRELLRAEPDATLVEAGSVAAKLSSTLAPRSFMTATVAAFAAAALLLAAIGLYGVLAYLVGRRTREIGIRMALGARAADVLRHVVGHAMALVGLGLGAGALLALFLARSLRGLLFGIEPADPATFAAVAALLAGVGLLASGLPAWRAARVDPSTALRSE
ncbi:MAG: ABC transporter permease [Gemmatimonadota bacterium]